MTLHFQQAPVASTDALNAFLPRIAGRPSVAARAPAINAAANLAARRLPGAAFPVPQAPEPITAPVHVLGLQDIVQKHDIKATPVRLWSHLLHAEGEPAPTAIAEFDAGTEAFQALSEGEEISQLGRRIRAVETAQASLEMDYDLALVRVPALSLTALWLKGRAGAPDEIIPNDSPQSPLTPGKSYSPQDFYAALTPVADQILKETDPLKGG
ncbi:MAG TPA: hypothetical protein VGM25_06695 [Caulobacteraceae bacterium]|jgi:hypothetical protein